VLFRSLAGPARAQAGRPEAGALYKDAAQPVAARVEDLLRRMTLEEKVAQMVGIWEKKGDIQAANGDFAPEKASRAFPHGLGQISRPSDFRGVDPSQNGAAGASGEAVNRDARQTAETNLAIAVAAGLSGKCPEAIVAGQNIALLLPYIQQLLADTEKRPEVLGPRASRRGLEVSRRQLVAALEKLQAEFGEKCRAPTSEPSGATTDPKQPE
jgi:hypothetical protein